MPTAKAICEQALAFLDAHRLPPLPQYYQLAFAFLAGSHGELAKAVGTIIDGGVRIAPEEADALSERFFGRNATQPAMPRYDAEAAAIRHQTLRLADLAAAATAVTGEFNRDLAERLPSIGTADAASLYDLFVAVMERAQRAEQDLAATTAEVEQLRQKLEVVQGDAERDALTGLPNRRGIDAYLATARETGEPMVIALCDIDRFKSYNDRYGHGVGDRVLKTVAQSLQESLPGQFVGRWGGEEFLVVAKGDVATGVDVLEDAKAALGARHFKLRETDEPMGRISFSAGVTTLPSEADQLDDALKKADALLYQAKSGGRDRVIGG